MNKPIGRLLRVLVIVEDNARGRRIVDYLSDQRMEAVPLAERNEIKRHFAERKPDLGILDFTCIRNNGLVTLCEIRSISNVPLIVINYNPCCATDRVAALELGADDYISKPFGLRELLARTRAVLRRSKAELPTHLVRRELDPVNGEKWRFGGWQFNWHTQQLSDPKGVLIPLRKNEYTLLMAFLNSPNTPLSRLQLIRACRLHDDIVDRTVDVQIVRLRRKLESDSGNQRIIQTVRGVGYVLNLPVVKVKDAGRPR